MRQSVIYLVSSCPQGHFSRAHIYPHIIHITKSATVSLFIRFLIFIDGFIFLWIVDMFYEGTYHAKQIQAN